MVSRVGPPGGLGILPRVEGLRPWFWLISSLAIKTPFSTLTFQGFSKLLHLEATMEGQATASPENHAGGPLLVWDLSQEALT